MPWRTCSPMSERLTFVSLANAPDANHAELCRRFGISRRTGYKWRGRVVRNGADGLQDHSRRPHHSPRRTVESVETAIVELRRAHPAWGSRKIGRILRDRAMKDVPADSTITDVLRRHGLLAKEEAEKHRAWQRFEHEAPNDLWQMDFKGHFALTDGVTRCHPLTILDDHSRFSIALHACTNERRDVVQDALIAAFRQYGMPLSILCDNGPPWGTPSSDGTYTRLAVWLIRYGVRMIHGRPLHPQTQGKDERFHRTLNAELLRDHRFASFTDCTNGFARWRETYNCVRPHQALGMQTPASRYRISPRPFPEQLPPIEYGPDDLIRKVQDHGRIYFRGRTYIVGKAFIGLPIALRPTAHDGLYDIYFCQQHVAQLDLRATTDSEKV